MMIQETIRKLYEMKLYGMAKAFEDQLASAGAGHLSFEERFGMLVDQEATLREDRRLTRLLQSAKLKENACVEDIDFRPGRGLERAEIASLALGRWIQNGLNMIVTPLAMLAHSRAPNQGGLTNKHTQVLDQRIP